MTARTRVALLGLLIALLAGVAHVEGRSRYGRITGSLTSMKDQVDQLLSGGGDDEPCPGELDTEERRNPNKNRPSGPPPPPGSTINHGRFNARAGKDGVMFSEWSAFPKRVCYHPRNTDIPNFFLQYLKLNESAHPPARSVDPEVIINFAKERAAVVMRETTEFWMEFTTKMGRAAESAGLVSDPKPKQNGFVGVFAEESASTEDPSQGYADQSVDDFCGYYRSGSWVKMQAYVAVKLNQFNPGVIVQKLVTKVAAKIHLQLMKHFASSICSFYNKAIDHEMCIFSKSRSTKPYSYMIDRKTEVPCISGIQPSTCPVDSVYLPIPFGEDFYPVRNLQRCDRLSTYIPRCDEKEVFKLLETSSKLSEEVLITIIEFMSSFFTYVAAKLTGIHDLFASMLEHICVHRTQPRPEDVPQYCAEVLEPAFDWKKTIQGFGTETAIEFITQARTWEVLMKKVFKSAGKFIPILDIITIILDEITSDIRKGNCASAIASISGSTSVIDLTYGQKWKLNKYESVSQLITNVGVINKWIDQFATKVADKFADVLLGGAK